MSPTYTDTLSYGDATMTLRDYFAAHAPADPWSHFAPIMLQARPKPEYDHVHPSKNCYDCDVINWEEIKAWDQQHAEQRLVQWPWFYADAMLQARDRAVPR